jgi:hypothetical protein
VKSYSDPDSHRDLPSKMAFSGIPKWLAIPLEERLREQGFIIQGKTARRITNRKVDIIGIEPVRMSLRLKWRVPHGSLIFEPGCFLPFAPSMEAKIFQCCRQSMDKRLSYPDCQIRFSTRRRVLQPEIESARDLWFADPESDGDEEVVHDILRAFEEAILPFFAEVEDFDLFLEYLRNGKDNLGSEGIWNIGRLGSFRRLMLMGFVALEAEQWDLARESLSRCLETIDSKRLNISPAVRDCISNSRSLALEHKQLQPCSP